MRRAVVIVVLTVFASVALFGQVTEGEVTEVRSGRPEWLFGVSAGAGVSGSVGGLYSHPEFVEQWTVPGYAIGLSAEVAVLPSLLWLGLGAEVEHSGHGYHFVGGSTDARYNETVTYFAVPLVVKAAFAAGPGDFTVGLGGALEVALATGGSVTPTSSGLTTRLAGTYFDGYLQRVNGAIVATSGYEVPTAIGRFGADLSVKLHLFSDFAWPATPGDNRFVAVRLYAFYRLGIYSGG